MYAYIIYAIYICNIKKMTKHNKSFSILFILLTSMKIVRLVSLCYYAVLLLITNDFVIIIIYFLSNNLF